MSRVGPGSNLDAEHCNSMYTNVPQNLKTDSVLPPISELPSLLTSLGNPRKHRSVSVGPQSEADAYEALAFRDKQRRESTSAAPRKRQLTKGQVQRDSNDCAESTIKAFSNNVFKDTRIGALPTPVSSQLNLHNESALPDVFHEDISTPGTLPSTLNTSDRRSSEDRREFENERREIFSMVEQPRVRYDVEVITKLIVYTGSNTQTISHILY